MAQRNQFYFSRSIKLGPAIGDWTLPVNHDVGIEEVNISQVRNIGFDGLPEDLLTYTHYMHYRLAEKLTRKLAQDMNIKVELHTVKATQIAYEDFLALNADKVVQADLVMGNIGRSNVIIEWALADKIVNRLTGGDGEVSGVDQFSDLEAGILKAQIEEILPSFTDMWRSVIDPSQLNLEFFCGNYVPDRKLSRREAYIFYTFYFYFGEDKLGKIMWAYPNQVLRKLLLFRKQQADPLKTRVSLSEQVLNEIQIPVTCSLGKATLTMNELRNLQEGDIIPLDSSLSTPVSIQVGDGAISGQPGTRGKKLCVQVILDAASSVSYVGRTVRETMSAPASFSRPENFSEEITNIAEPLIEEPEVVAFDSEDEAQESRAFVEDVEPDDDTFSDEVTETEVEASDDFESESDEAEDDDTDIDFGDKEVEAISEEEDASDQEEADDDFADTDVNEEEGQGNLTQESTDDDDFSWDDLDDKR